VGESSSHPRRPGGVSRGRTPSRRTIRPQIRIWPKRLEASLDDPCVVAGGISGHVSGSGRRTSPGPLHLVGPDLDSASVFAAVLDAERGGSFRLAPEGQFATERRYVPETNVLGGRSGIRLRQPRRGRLASARIYVNGRRCVRCEAAGCARQSSSSALRAAGSGHDRGPDEHRADGGGGVPLSDVRAEHRAPSTVTGGASISS
jgi:hypothetical protein